MLYVLIFNNKNNLKVQLEEWSCSAKAWTIFRLRFRLPNSSKQIGSITSKSDSLLSFAFQFVSRINSTTIQYTVIGTTKCRTVMNYVCIKFIDQNTCTISALAFWSLINYYYKVKDYQPGYFQDFIVAQGLNMINSLKSKTVSVK